MKFEIWNSHIPSSSFALLSTSTLQFFSGSTVCLVARKNNIYRKYSKIYGLYCTNRRLENVKMLTFRDEVSVYLFLSLPFVRQDTREEKYRVSRGKCYFLTWYKKQFWLDKGEKSRGWGKVFKFERNQFHSFDVSVWTCVLPVW